MVAIYEVDELLLVILWNVLLQFITYGLCVRNMLNILKFLKRSLLTNFTSNKYKYGKHLYTCVQSGQGNIYKEHTGVIR